jgi:hypothetical protein
MVPPSLLPPPPADPPLRLVPVVVVVVVLVVPPVVTIPPRVTSTPRPNIVILNVPLAFSVIEGDVVVTVSVRVVDAPLPHD